MGEQSDRLKDVIADDSTTKVSQRLFFFWRNLYKCAVYFLLNAL